jgi:predicted NUDIX family phosphoesterase
MKVTPEARFANEQVEQILVIPTAVLHELGHFQGFTTDLERYLGKLLDPALASYMPRPAMEQDPSYKQLIPYVIFTHTNLNGTKSIFAYTRGTGQGEKRLHAKRSIGVGGHISTLDLQGDESTAYEQGMRRELAEEVEYPVPVSARCAGLINDDLTPVGQVHLGVVHVFELAEPRVTPREAAMISAGFVPASELLKELDHFETWSQYALQALFA